ncbi:cytochrome P450 [Lentithecium fluviatile CBS 122367]|uniref:Cytochrome P450 n=1 Tax=Lentithecium fluviatile CBS 122367 TaxID=1168545 RepID=A0A6G1JC48_9PLEO|nr:cytochrome P450 [Lentithecium fluviatile CBS 122367]
MGISMAFPPEDFDLFSFRRAVLGLAVFISFVILRIIGSAIYNLYSHPLSHVPGPFFSRASNILNTLLARNGGIAPWLQAAHEKYGDVVRVAPNEVSFISGEPAWQDIYGFHRGLYATPINGTDNIIISNEADHSRGLVGLLVGMLVSRLHEQVEGKYPVVDITRRYNHTTFDTITDLTFGEPLYCLRDKDNHPWVSMIFESLKAARLMMAARRFSAFVYIDKIMGFFIDEEILKRRRAEFSNLVSHKKNGVLALTKGRNGVERNNSAHSWKRNNCDDPFGLYVSCLDQLARYTKVVEEVRGRFGGLVDITIEKVNKLVCLLATLQETLRYCPPGPTGFARIVPQGGDIVSGIYVPEGASVYMSQHTANHSKRNWTDPGTSTPERSLGDPKPFSFRLRNCLSKNLAYAEMRLIAAKVLFSFDLELGEESREWLKDQKAFLVWEKLVLMVKLHPVQR